MQLELVVSPVSAQKWREVFFRFFFITYVLAWIQDNLRAYALRLHNLQIIVLDRRERQHLLQNGTTCIRTKDDTSIGGQDGPRLKSFGQRSGGRV